jgi:hypothetical protein
MLCRNIVTRPKTADVRDILSINSAAAKIMNKPSPMFDKRLDEWLSTLHCSAVSSILLKASDCPQFIEMTQDTENGLKIMLFKRE